MTTPLRLLRLAGVVLGSMMLLVLAARSGGRALPPADEVAFVSRRTGHDEIFLLDVGRGLVRNLTASRPWHQNQSPDFTRDGAWLAFHSNRTGNGDIYIMPMHGDPTPTRLTHSRAIEVHPTWSPDGTRIAFQSIEDGDYDIYVLDVAEAMAGRATPTPITHNRSSDVHPVWSPDGDWIVFSANGDTVYGNYELAVMRPDGGARCRLNVLGVGRDANLMHPAFAPDGSAVLFQAFRDNGTSAVYTVPFPHGGQAQVVAGDQRLVDAYLPAWSNDGADVLFVSARTGHSELYVQRQALAEARPAPQRLTFNPTIDISPAWRPVASRRAAGLWQAGLFGGASGGAFGEGG